MNFISHVFTNGVCIVNTTPHEITFQDHDQIISIPNCGTIINAKVVETIVSAGIPTFVKTDFIGDSTGEEAIISIRNQFPDAIIVGSIIAAQAFPGKVFAMTPISGFERVAPAEKRMNPSKFTTFGIPEAVKIEEKEKTFEESVEEYMKHYEKEKTEDWEIVDEYRTHRRESEEIGGSSFDYHEQEMEIILEVIKRKGIDIEKN